MRFSLAWMEMRTTLAKLIWTYDCVLVDSTLDWHRDSKMNTLWKKPALMIRTERRDVVSIQEKSANL